ncbi:AAA family ATPase [Lentzea sp. BCCO 10_0798]|uniref:AAA family ATPase n=1 Tax=Lentzea kristufekii TaxID=3095430 RepID=A0ABU4U6G2_9PSEU|nr:AAA family ATPase [Lentzea sp. BCCO 10_0798]MDX8056153.1 AAA family ATPase [Lentzea sp. BCCO 10_0798]
MSKREASVPSERKVFVGRTEEVAAFQEWMGAAALVVVRGGGGIGKTTFLRELESVWAARGVTVLPLPTTADAPHWDVFRAQAVVDLIRDCFQEFDGAQLAGSVAAVSRLCDEARAASAPGTDALFAELVRLFKKLRANRPVAVFVDDADLAVDPVRAIAAAYRAGCTVVVTCREDGTAGRPASLSSLADHVVNLGPLTERSTTELLNRVVPAPLDEAVVPALWAALGPLAGNPGAVLTTVEALRRDNGFAEVLGHLCLRDPDPSALALPREHELVRHVEGLGDVGVQLMAVVSAADRFGIDDVLDFADALGHDLRRCGDAVDQLVATGAMACDHNGRLSVPCPALTTALVGGLGADRLRGIHRALAEHLLHAGTAELSVVTDHVALAGAALPADPSLVPLLEREATRVARANQPLAARWFRTALRHAEPGADRVRLLRIVLHLLLRTAQHTELAEVVSAEVTAGVDESCAYELATAAALASVHIGQPVPADVHDALAGDARARLALGFADRWFDGREAVPATEVAAAFAGFRVNRVLDWEHDPHGMIEVAADLYDVTGMLKLALGPCYGVPDSGPLGVYRELVRQYVDGDWPGVVSSARRLELSGPATAMHQVARLLSAEVHSACGDFRRAASWLGLGRTDDAFPALRAWVEVGLTYRGGERQPALEQGWAAYDRATGEQESGVGLPWLLLRLGIYEKRLDNGDGLARAAAEAERWYERVGGTNLRTAKLVLRALSEQDLAAATAAVELLRRRGNTVDLMLACMAVAVLCDDPAPWYGEALQLAKRLGEGWMDVRIKETMRKVGLAPPRARAARDDFSDVELQIIALVQHGKTNRQIATVLSMSEKTVENYLTRLFVRTGCRSRLNLATASLQGRLAGAAPERRS